jgi:hypothetical protein
MDKYMLYSNLDLWRARINKKVLVYMVKKREERLCVSVFSIKKYISFTTYNPKYT